MTGPSSLRQVAATTSGVCLALTGLTAPAQGLEPAACSRPVALEQLPGWDASGATAVNEAGVIVGIASDSSRPGEARPLRWRNGRVEALSVRNGVASDINDAGAVVGSVVTRSGQRKAYRWRAGRLDLLPGLGGRSDAVAINADGDAVGVVRDGFVVDHPALWRGGQLTVLPLPADFDFGDASDINDAGDIVGNAGKDFGGGEIYTPWLWRADGSSGPVRTDDYRDGRGLTIDNRGRMTGRVAPSPDEVFRAASWRTSDARPRVLRRFKETYSQFTAASGAGDLVGVVSPLSGGRRGFITDLPHYDRLTFLEPPTGTDPDTVEVAPRDVNRKRLVVGAISIAGADARATTWDCADD